MSESASSAAIGSAPAAGSTTAVSAQGAAPVEAAKAPAKLLPHYMKPNTAFVLPAYSNAEQEIIRSAFSTGSYKTISQLPTEFRPSYVHEAMAAHVDSNITSAVHHAPFGSYKRVTKDALFATFEYVPSPYSLADEVKTADREKHKATMATVAKREFVYSSSFPDAKRDGKAAGQSSADAKASAGSESQRSDSLPGNVYESLHDAQLREKWLQQSKILHGPFIPASGTRSLNTSHRSRLPHVMQLLAKELDSDWGDCAFEIYSDPEDLIIIKFDLASLENPVGLLTYMNMLSSSNPIVSENKLSKVVELWNHRPGDGSLYFCYKPVHVKRAASEVFFTLHPEHRSFQTLRAAQDAEREQRRQLAEQQRADQREALGLDRTYSVAAAGEADGGQQQQQQLQQQQQQSLADSAASGPIRQRVGAQDSPGAGAGSGAGSAGAAGSGGTAVIGGAADHESEFERFKRDRAQQSQLRRQQELQQRQQGAGGASAAAAGADDGGADFL